MGGAYVRDKNTSAGLRIQNAGGTYARGGVFAGRYGTTFEYLVRILFHVDNLRKRYNFTEI